jgi:hypothetical protein
VVLSSSIGLHVGNRLKEREEKRIVHELVEDSTCLVQLCRVRRGRTTRKPKQLIADTSRKVHLSWSTRDNVNLHELFPQNTDAIVALLRVIRIVRDHFIIKCGVSL